jgi:hypothetical protein
MDILCKLIGVEEVVNGPDARFNPGGIQWRWIFETMELTNEDDDPFRLSYYTGTSYQEGNQKSKLTKLLDRICRDLTTEEKESLDTDTLLGKKFRIDVTHVKKTDGALRAQIDSIKRVQAKPGKPLTKKEEDVDDPYADEN